MRRVRVGPCQAVDRVIEAQQPVACHEASKRQQADRRAPVCLQFSPKSVDEHEQLGRFLENAALYGHRGATERRIRRELSPPARSTETPVNRSTRSSARTKNTESSG